MKKIIVIFGIILLNSCGFKVVQNEQFNRYYISQINTEGDNKINYRIKNKIITSSNKTDKLATRVGLVGSVPSVPMTCRIAEYELGVNTHMNHIALSLSFKGENISIGAIQYHIVVCKVSCTAICI